jgi:F-type H+-transporting ATPase subunit gamma
MTNLRDVRLRMRSIRQALQVTKAMNLISTAKLRKSRRTLLGMEPYFTRIQKIMFDILSGTTIEKSRFIRPPGNTDSARTAIIVITSDKGLAGDYNANIFHQVDMLCSKVKNPVLILIGAIGYGYFINSPWLILENFSFMGRMPDLDDAKEIAEFVISQYGWGMFDEVHIVYTHMYSAVKLVPRERELLPLDIKQIQQEFEKEGDKRRTIHLEYWPSPRKVFDALVPMYVKGVLFGTFIEAYASEQRARMSAMDEASKNAENMLTDLKVYYTRARQASITQEMTEIVGGAESLS